MFLACPGDLSFLANAMEVILCSLALWVGAVFSSGASVVSATWQPDQKRRIRLARVPAFVALAIVLVVMKRWGAQELREEWVESVWLLVGAAVSLGMLTSLMTWLGFSISEDWISNRNTAAFVAISSVQIGFALCIAGSNVGEGDNILQNVFCAGLATGTWMLLWILLNAASPLAEIITVERSGSAAAVAASYLVCSGAILGRAVMGDWESTQGTMKDFVRFGWPVGLLWLTTAIGSLTMARLGWNQTLLRKTTATVATAAVLGVTAFTLKNLGPWTGPLSR